MAEVVASTTLNLQVKGRVVKKVMHLQRHDDPESVARMFCKQYKLRESECEKVVPVAKQKHVEGVAASNKKVEPTLHLILQHYNDRFDKRRHELEACLRFNLNNPHVLKVHNLIEAETELAPWITGHPKSIVVRHGPRLSFKAGFEYASAHIPSGSSVVLMNLDTYLDHASPWHLFSGDIASLTRNQFRGKMALTLSRTETDTSGRIWRNADLEASAYAMAQDAWVFKNPVQIDDADYPVGNCPGSDNAIAERFHRAGWTPMNFAHLFRVYHLDVARKSLSAEELPKMIVTHKTDISRPHLRGQRVVPVFGDISSFRDLGGYKDIWGEVDPVIEYMFVLEYMGMKARIQQKFAQGGVIPDGADIKGLGDLRKAWQDQVDNGEARPGQEASGDLKEWQKYPPMQNSGVPEVTVPRVAAT